MEIYLIFCITTLVVFLLDWYPNLIKEDNYFNDWISYIIVSLVIFFLAPLAFILMLHPTGKKDFIKGMIEKAGKK